MDKISYFDQKIKAESLMHKLDAALYLLPASQASQSAAIGFGNINRGYR